MNLSYQVYPMICLLLIGLGSGCRSSVPLHFPNPKAVYVVPPEGLPFIENGLMYETTGSYTRVVGQGTIPAGWLIVSPE